jgi:hypothetical protein
MSEAARSVVDPAAEEDVIARALAQLRDQVWQQACEQGRPVREAAATLISEAPPGVERYLATAFLTELACAHGRRMSPTSRTA